MTVAVRRDLFHLPRHSVQLSLKVKLAPSGHNKFANHSARRRATRCAMVIDTMINS